jgi:probable rRNA maturation factor
VKILSNNIHTSRKVDEPKLRDAAAKIMQYCIPKSFLAQYEFDTVSFEILFCDNAKTHEINREYRGKDKPADIITFAIFADSEPRMVLDGEINLGEIIISLDEERASRGSRGAAFADPEPFSEELFLISHGIMHLLGFDHNTEAEYNFVIGLQEEAIRTLHDEIQMPGI